MARLRLALVRSPALLGSTGDSCPVREGYALVLALDPHLLADAVTEFLWKAVPRPWFLGRHCAVGASR